MSEPEPRTPVEATTLPKSPLAKSLLRQARPLLLGVPLLTVLTGVVFPLILLIFAQVLFPYRAKGSLIRRQEKFVGAEWIGQKFEGPAYFNSRPSAAGYDALASGGTNLAPNNKKLRTDVQRRTDEYRRCNHLSAETAVPIDAVTCSGSGLDPHISPENADLQVARVARERHLERSSGPAIGDGAYPRAGFGFSG